MLECNNLLLHKLYNCYNKFWVYNLLEKFKWTTISSIQDAKQIRVILLLLKFLYRSCEFLNYTIVENKKTLDCSHLHTNNLAISSNDSCCHIYYSSLLYGLCNWHIWRQRASEGWTKGIIHFLHLFTIYFCILELSRK